MADLIQNKNDQTALQAAAQEVLATCAPPPPIPPGAPNAQQLLQQAEQNAENVTRGTAARILGLGERDTRLAFTVLEGLFAGCPRFRVTVLDPGLVRLLHNRRSARRRKPNIMDRAIRANVRINSLNARGLYVHQFRAATPAPTPRSPCRHDEREDPVSERRTRWPKKAIMEELADATGGRYFHNNNDLKGGLRAGGRDA